MIDNLRSFNDLFPLNEELLLIKRQKQIKTQIKFVNKRHLE